jgi:hypothetical protein
MPIRIHLAPVVWHSASFFLQSGKSPKSGRRPQFLDSKRDLLGCVVEKMVRPRFEPRINGCSPAKKA